ncbi:MAG: endonuclease domain-containing protein [Candidatus Marinimicrobia bacterium]|jgi:very-short-patch-repair endonuclease|nr:endonuclease domain-containing protein [Candidatus Neomarinimicrobiota bacterium]MBT3617869.1 endonuclease domain-containing protein [Candidatus Neomarinimicrobiota bacterium]MBT3828965.1 endonuclease domain-containing protein [Candidatus Neomarinimicrobiota bacterium]MBT3998183.1 endonuclease domain-containing protein [Candidatus Neomarinimicrobiota bacterium]MBT4280489.1 endonuclease domain-containing protein [Candidatus Neomarinimicrobiota bacterium]
MAKIYYNPKLKQLSRNLRNNSTLSEVLLWNQLKQKQMMGFQFNRQRPIGEFIVDFYCPKLKLVIEIDGESHNDRENEDQRRTDFLESLGLTVIRFDDNQVKQGLEYVLQDIENWIRKKLLQK